MSATLWNARRRDIAERDEKIVALAKQGFPPRVIKRALPNVSIGTIYMTLKAARERGIGIPLFSTKGQRRAPDARTVVVPSEVLHRLEEPAAWRGISAVALARLIITTVAEENLVAAVLDDGVSAAGRAAA